MFVRQICKLRTLQRLEVKKYLKPFTLFHSSFYRQQFSLANFSRSHSLILRNKLLKTNILRAFSSYGKVDVDHKLYKSELDEFLAAREVFYNALLEEENKSLTDVIKWFSQVCEYNLKSGKRNRGTAVLKTYKTLSNDVTTEGALDACTLGWCLELLQAYFIVADDIMDQSTFRRGEPCWYTKPEVGLIAVNDSLLLQSGVYKVLRRRFEKREFYNSIVQEFLQVTEKTAYGQCLDMLSNPQKGKSNFALFTSKRYKAIVEYKTSYYTFCLPIHLAMYLIGNRTAEEFQITKDLGLKLGLLFQIQDDYLDCYGDPEVTGKFGTDIAQGKCTWFAVKFLEMAEDSLKKEWKATYGVDDEKSVSKVLSLYDTVNMMEKYKKFEQELYSDINYFIKNKLESKSMQELFFYLLQKAYKRNV